MQKHEKPLRRLMLSCLYLGLGLSYGFGFLAHAQSPTPAPAPAQTDVPAEEKRFRWTATGKVYLRYGGIEAPRPTNLFGFELYKPEGGEVVGNPYRTYEEYLRLNWDNRLSDSEKSRVSKQEYVKQGNAERQENIKQIIQSYDEPLLETGDFGLDLYELLLGFEASSPKQKKWQGKVRAEWDVFELATRLSGNDLGGRPVTTNDFDSAGVREAFVSLSRAKVGELRIGIAEGVVRRLDAGQRAISSGNDFFGDVSRTPWHVQQLEWELGSGASDNFPKIQYFAPKFYGVSLGTEWFSNLRSPNNHLETFSRDNSSLCFPSLFYGDDKKLFEPNPNAGDENFLLHDNKGVPFEKSTLGGDPYFLQGEILPSPVREARCWQRSPTGSSWHEDVSPQVMGGNVVVAYEKDFSRKKLSLAFATRYGIRSSKAQAVESNEYLFGLFKEWTRFDLPEDSPLSKINRKASVLQHSAGVSTGLTWSDYSFFGNVTYLVPSSITLENVGGETFSQKGTEGILWSVGIKVTDLIPHKKGSDSKRKKKGSFSVSFAQAFIKDPRYNGGSQEKTFLLSLQSLYPITDNIALVVGYWYGEAAVSVPFFVTATEVVNQGVLFYERRLIPNHEAVVGLTMRF